MTIPPSAGETFPHRLRRLRLAAGLSRHALGDAIGCAKATVYGWEIRGLTPLASHIEPLARAFGVSADYLLTGEECAELQRALLRLETAAAEINALKRPRHTVPFRIGQAA